MSGLLARLGLAMLLVHPFCASSQAQTINTIAAGALNTPQGIARAANGNLYVANAGNNTLSLVQPGGIVTTLVSRGLSTPNGVAVDGSGNILVASITGSNVTRVTPGGEVTVFAGPAQGLFGPKGIAIDGTGNIYVCDIGTHSVFKFSPDGAVSTFVPAGQGLQTPAALAFDAGDNLYITDPGTAKIFKVTPAGTVSIFASGFFSGEGLAFDPSGNLYSTDDANGSIYKIAPDGTRSVFVSTPGAWGIVADGSGGFYFTNYFGDTVNTLTAAGSVSPFASSAVARPAGLVFGSNGDFFFSNSRDGTIGLLAPYTRPTTFARGLGTPSSMVRDGAGNLYVADDEARTISKVAPDGSVTPFATDVAGPIAIDSAGNIYSGGEPTLFTTMLQKITPTGAKSDYIATQWPADGMVVDAEGNLYIAASAITFSTVHLPAKITKVTPSLTQTTVATNLSGALTLDGGGNLYVGHGSGVVRIAPDGTQTALVTDARIRSVAAMQFDVLGNVLGNLYIADSVSNAVLQVVLANSPLLAAVLPGSRAVRVGRPATTFATILNAGDTALNNCRMYLAGTAPPNLSLDFQTTNPNTNTVTGTRNQAVPIAGHGSQSYVIALGATGPLQLIAMPLVYACDGASPAPPSPGVNSIDLLFSSADVPDIIVQAVTATNDGILDVPFNEGRIGAFAAATVDVGIGGTLTVVADTGGADLPVTPLVCPSDPQTAACLQPAAPSARVTIASGATPTFSVFVSASAEVPFAPDTARVYLRFLDEDGISHGSASVAVRTQ